MYQTVLIFYSLTLTLRVNAQRTLSMVKEVSNFLLLTFYNGELKDASTALPSFMY